MYCTRLCMGTRRMEVPAVSVVPESPRVAVTCTSPFKTGYSRVPENEANWVSVSREGCQHPYRCATIIYEVLTCRGERRQSEGVASGSFPHRYEQWFSIEVQPLHLTSHRRLGQVCMALRAARQDHSAVAPPNVQASVIGRRRINTIDFAFAYTNKRAKQCSCR